MIPARRRAAVLAMALAAAACGPKEEPSAERPPAAKSETVPAVKPAAPMPPKPVSSPIPKDGEVKSLPSGLKYSVLTEGKGAKPKRNDMVTVHYTGWLPDGTEFDSSRKRGEPAQFQVGRIVEGWNQSLPLMSVGSRWKITIPPDLGYGAAGNPPVIPPNATLIFDIELLDIRPAPVYRAVDPAAAKDTASGLKYEILDPGAGPAPAETDPFELEYAIFSAEGELLRTSVFTSETIQGRKSDMAMPLLKEAPFLLKEGGTILCDVPPEMATKPRPGAKAPPGPKTVWRLKLLRVGKPGPAPAFVLPPGDRLRTTPSGLKHQALVEGKGEAPGPGDEVVVRYAGWLADGTPFDNSYERGLPSTFRLGPGRLIQGWNEGLRTMRPGGTSIFVVPSELGYGSRGHGSKIPPGATLVFRIELLEVKK